MRLIRGLFVWLIILIGIATALNFDAVSKLIMDHCTRTITVEVERIVPVQEQTKSVDEILNSTPQAYGVTREEIEALISTENGAWDTDAVNFNYNSNSLDTADHGLMQVNARTGKMRGVTWIELHNPETNIEIGTWHWAMCRDKEKLNAKSKRDWMIYTGACYNGGEGWRKNAPEMKAKAIAHGEKIVAKLEQKLLEKFL